MTAAAITARLLRDVLGRVVWIREEATGPERESALEELEFDLAAEIRRLDELDAIPPDKLKGLVDEAIRLEVDPEAWAKAEAVEKSERQILERMAGTVA